jgi:signal transduction histidine kinase/CheY-like chemotaxis protein
MTKNSKNTSFNYCIKITTGYLAGITLMFFIQEIVWGTFSESKELMFLLTGIIILSLLFVFLMINKYKKNVISPLNFINTKLDSAKKNMQYEQKFTDSGIPEIQEIEQNIASLFTIFNTLVNENEIKNNEVKQYYERLKKICSLVPLPLLTININNEITYANEFAYNFFNVKKGEFAGNNLKKYINLERDLLLSKSVVKETPDDSVENVHGPVLIRRRHENDEQRLQVYISSFYIAGQWNGIILIHDVTDFYEKERLLLREKEKAEKSDMLKSVFISNMSHEVRTPLNTIIGFTELLSKTDIQKEKKDIYTRYILSSGKNLLNLINDIIDISKIEAGRLKIQKSNFSLHELLDELLTGFKENLTEDKRHIELRVHHGKKKDFEVYSDPYRIKQIYSNLISNALKFTEEGYIEFGYKMLDQEIQFFVKDTGIGIPKEQREKIFKRFGQVEETLEKNKTGTGLGLAISKKLVELLGGSIRVDSEVQKGSVFYFTIPCIKENTEKTDDTANEQTKKSSKYKWGGKKILIAEDEEINYIYLSEAIASTGAKTVRAKNGYEAIEKCKTEDHIDLVLMDIKMPGLDGYKATEKIKEYDSNITVIAQTAYALVGEKEKSMSHQCDDYIPKPIKPADLLTLMNKYLS